MRCPKPWYRASRDAWFVQLAGRQVLLAKGKDSGTVAWAEFHRLMLEQGRMVVDSETIPFANLADLFLEACRPSAKPATFAWYKRFIDDFCDTYVGLAKNLAPSHVLAWIASHEGWSFSTQRGAIVAIKRVIQWAIKDRKIQFDPLVGLERPKTGRRQVVACQTEMTAIVAASDAAFGEFVTALRLTGARPPEVRLIEARHFDPVAETWTLQPEECVKPSDRPRVIFLNAEMLELSKRLAERYPTGPLFRNSRGQPWTANAVICRMRRLREKGVLAKGTVSYSFRHGFATDALGNGVHMAELAQLMGHQGTKMLDEHYAHLDQRAEQLKNAAKRATG